MHIKIYYKVNVYRNQSTDILNVIFIQQNNDTFILQTIKRLGMVEKPESSILSMEEGGGWGDERHFITVMILVERITWLEGRFGSQQKANGVV